MGASLSTIMNLCKYTQCTQSTAKCAVYHRPEYLSFTVAIQPMNNKIQLYIHIVPKNYIGTIIQPVKHLANTIMIQEDTTTTATKDDVKN